jgi:hypothetical protein
MVEYFCNVVTALETTPVASLLALNRLLLVDTAAYGLGCHLGVLCPHGLEGLGTNKS